MCNTPIEPATCTLQPSGCYEWSVQYPCPTGTACVNGACATSGFSDGAPCGSATQCASGYCANTGTCVSTCGTQQLYEQCPVCCMGQICDAGNDIYYCR
jgi:hypothetical protein